MNQKHEADTVHINQTIHIDRTLIPMCIAIITLGVFCGIALYQIVESIFNSLVR